MKTQIPQKVHSPQFSAKSVVTKRLYGSRCHLVRRYALAPVDIVLDVDPAPLPRKGHSNNPLFSAHVYCGQTVAHLIYCWAVVYIFLQIQCNFFCLLNMYYIFAIKFCLLANATIACLLIYVILISWPHSIIILAITTIRLYQMLNSDTLAINFIFTASS